MSLTGIIGGVLGTVKGIVTLDLDRVAEGVHKTATSTWTTATTLISDPLAPQKIIHDEDDHSDENDWTSGSGSSLIN